MPDNYGRSCKLLSAAHQKVSMEMLRDRIRSARKYARLTQAELAGKLGVVPSAIAQWERPLGSAPTSANLIRIADLLDVSFEWLATGRGVPHKNVAETPALELRYFAMDGSEERLLATFRGLGPEQRKAVSRLLESFALS
jgi:transcriptional regulator with XRE-family HTH domain